MNGLNSPYSRKNNPGFIVQKLIYIPALVLYYLAFRVMYTQFRLAKLLKVNDIEHKSAWNIYSHKNIEFARKYAKQLDDEDLIEKLLITARQYENSRANFVRFVVLILIFGVVFFMHPKYR